MTKILNAPTSVLCLLTLSLAACSPKQATLAVPGSSPPTTPTTPLPQAVVSGTLSSSIGPVDGATLKSLTIVAETDTEQSTSTSDASGAFSISVQQGTQSYLEFSKTGFATRNSPFFFVAQNISAVNIAMLSESDAGSIIGTAFGGMMLSLADKAWLAIDVRDATGSEISGVFITSTPLPNGGGALFCNGTLTGANVTAASPPCNPPRAGPMYLAYFDAARQVGVSVSGASDV